MTDPQTPALEVFAFEVGPVVRVLYTKQDIETYGLENIDMAHNFIMAVLSDAQRYAANMQDRRTEELLKLNGVLPMFDMASLVTVSAP